MKNSISTVKAASTSKEKLLYNIDSKYFTVNRTDGRIFLISPLRPTGIMTRHSFNITATDGLSTATLLNTISVLAVNKNAPVFDTSPMIFEVQEV